ncbi:MAG: DUF3147 family protein [Sphingomonas sp.]|nr:DUF3147 family protein [Sphingomonas sp.]
MLYLLVKAAVSGLLIAIISEVARRSPGWGGLLASLPLTTLLAMIWLWRDTGDPQRVGDLALGAFWFVLPSLPLFVIIPLLLRAGWGFWPALLAGCAVTLALYAAMFAVSGRLGVRF